MIPSDDPKDLTRGYLMKVGSTGPGQDHRHRAERGVPVALAGLALCILAAPAIAQDSSVYLATQQMDAAQAFELYGVFSELNFSNISQDNSVLHPVSSRNIGMRIGAIVVAAPLNSVIVPSLTVHGISGSTTNPFATIDTAGRAVGADIFASYALTEEIDMTAGAGISIGRKALTFNGGHVPSITHLQTYYASLGLGYVLYQNEGLTVRLSDQVTFGYTHADYDPLNSVDESSARTLENRLSLSAFYDLTGATKLDAEISFVNLIVAQQLEAENPPDRVYGLVSLGLSHEVADNIDVYGRGSIVAGGTRSGSVLGQIGIRTRF